MKRRERELEATVRRPAEAEKFRLEKLAEANKVRYSILSYYQWMNLIWELFFHFTEPSHLRSWGRKRINPKWVKSVFKFYKFLKLCQKFSISVRGEAEAFAIQAKAKAESEQMAKKAEAWREYREAAMVEMLLDTLPKIAAEVAAPLSQTKKITMVSSGSSEIGAAKLTGEVLQIVNKVPELVKSITGVDISRSVHAG